MNQSSVIGASLIVAYAVFIVYKGELPCYLTVLGISSATGCPQALQPAGCSGGSSSTSTIGSTLGGTVGSAAGGILGGILSGIINGIGFP
jgi:hypothetical protein